MPVLEARREPLYLVDRCAPCKGYRGPYFAPLRRIVGRWTPSPSFEDLVCAPFYVLRSSSRGTEPRQGETVPVDMFIISTSKPLLRFSSLDMGPLCPLPLHPSRRYKPIRSEERRARWTSCEEHVQRPQPFHFLGRGEEGEARIVSVRNNAMCYSMMFYVTITWKLRIQSWVWVGVDWKVDE